MFDWSRMPRVVTREEWLGARKALLEKEKALTRARDELNAERRQLPMVEITREYRFDGPAGTVGLLDLFEGRQQLIVQHFMFNPDWDEGCPSCSAWTDQIARSHLNHLHATSTTLAVISRAPLSRIEPFKRRMGWTLPWYSSFGSDFNYDFHVTLDESIAPLEYNYRSADEHIAAGTGYYVEGEQPIELPGLSCFLQADGRVYHTYSTYARGGAQVGGAHFLLDLTVLGRQEEWEEPKGRAGGLGVQAGSDRVLYPDQYDE